MAKERKPDTRGFFRGVKRYDFDNRRLNKKTGELEYIPSLTKQSEAAACDINNILRQYTETGVLRHISRHAAQGMYVDLPEPMDFQESMNIIAKAGEAFDALPSKVRTRFANDPVQFLAFMSDPKNQDEMIKLGLASDARRPEKPPEVKAPPEKSADVPKDAKPPASTA